MDIFNSFWGGFVIGIIVGQLLALALAAFVFGARASRDITHPSTEIDEDSSNLTDAAFAFRRAERNFLRRTADERTDEQSTVAAEAGLRAALPYLRSLRLKQGFFTRTKARD